MIFFVTVYKKITKNAGKTTVSFALSAAFRRKSEFPPPFPLRNGIPPLKRLVDEDDIVPDPLDTLPRNVVLLPPAEQPEKAVRAKDNDGHHLSLRHPHIHVRHIPKTAAVADVDDLLTP